MRLPNYWSMPSWLRAFIRWVIPAKHEWTLRCYRLSSGHWAFSMPRYLVFDELLMGGTEHAVDHFYRALHGHEPVAGSRVVLTVSTEELANQTTTLKLIGADPDWTGSHDYWDTVAGIRCWLCPMLPMLFGMAPEALNVRVE